MARLQAGFIQARPTLLLAAVLAYACGGEAKPGGPTEPQPSKKLAGLVVSPTAMALFSGDEMPVNAAAVDADGNSVTGTVIRWASSDTMVASIDGNGVARARGNGDAVITVSADTFRVKVSVQVNAAADAVNTKLSTNGFFLHQEEPSITIDAVGRVLVGWKEMDAPAGVKRVAFSASMDNGQTWTSPTLMDLGTGFGASDPWLATDKSGALLYARVHTTRDLPWIDPWRIVVSRSTDGGLTWGELVVTNPGNGADKPALHRDATGNLLLAYVSYTSTRNQIAVSRSLDNGATWEASRTIPGAGSLSHGPVVVGGLDGSANVAWWSRPDENILFATITYGQTEPVVARRLNTTPGTARFFLNQGLVLQPAFPSIVRLPSGRLIVGWPDYAGNDWNVFVVYSDDGGKNWSDQIQVSDSRLDKQWMIALAAGGDGTLHAAWYDARNGNTHVVYAKSTDGGTTWSRNVRVTSVPTPGTSSRMGDYFSIAADAAGKAYVVWTDARTVDLDVYFARIVK